jgi:hypothetical protein
MSMILTDKAKEYILKGVIEEGLYISREGGEFLRYDSMTITILENEIRIGYNWKGNEIVSQIEHVHLSDGVSLNLAGLRGEIVCKLL